jgi:peptidyl-prolyl cis-trans isomerase SurA
MVDNRVCDARALGLVAAVCVFLLPGLGCRSNPSAAPAAPAVTADTWAVVDGRQITRDDVERGYRRTPESAQNLSDDEALAAKLTLLNDLIVQDILLAKARELKVDIAQSELDSAYAEARKNISDEEFQKELTARKLTPDDMREGLRRELIIQKVLNQEVTSKITVTDQEISDFYTANRTQFNVPEEAYHIAQIVVTPEREPQITNQTGDDATTPQAALEKAQMLMERLKGGASFRDLAIGFSEDAESAPRGGDLGLVPVSRLKQAPPQLRNAVLNKEPGSVNVASAGGAHTLVLVVAHEQPGQRDLSMPAVRERITELLRGRKEQLRRSAYLTAARDRADVVNHFARRLTDSFGTAPAPAVQPAAPGSK